MVIFMSPNLQKLLRCQYITQCSYRFAHKKINKTPIGNSFTVVYKLPYITICSVISRIKRYNLVASGALIPISYAGYLCQFIDQDLPLIVTSVGLATCTAFLTVGHFFNRLIGFVYVSKNRSHVKISYLDYWGHRQDEIFPIESIKSLRSTDSHYIPVNVRRVLSSKVEITNMGKPLNINLKYGDIVSSVLFKQVFNYDFEGEEDKLQMK